MVRAAAVLAILAALAAYDALAATLPDVPTWWDVAFLSLVLLPSTFALAVLALPARAPLARGRLAPAVLALGALAVALQVAGLDVAANLVKFGAVTLAGWWFLGFFEAVGWVLLVALLIIPIDIYSVARGPTKVIVERQPEVFNALSIAFPVLGEHASAQLGLPDVLFFALFLAASERFGLRTHATWLAMVLSFGATLAAAVHFSAAGLPALPLLSAAFVLVNVDRLWTAVRARKDARRP